MRGHKIVTLERGGGYAARCEVIVGGELQLCGITFGGFATRTAAREALTHETPPASGYSSRATTRIENPMSEPTVQPMPEPTAVEIVDALIETPGEPTKRAYRIPSVTGCAHFIDWEQWPSDDRTSWRVLPAQPVEYLTVDDARAYLRELQAAIDRADALNTVPRELRRPADATVNLADRDV